MKKRKVDLVIEIDESWLAKQLSEMQEVYLILENANKRLERVKNAKRSV